MKICPLQIFVTAALASTLLGRIATPENGRPQTAATPKIAADAVATADAKPTFVFGSVGYFHRWSDNDQHEFTPTSQNDLQKWTDMITINVMRTRTMATRLQ
jgi:hypothetical protein